MPLSEAEQLAELARLIERGDPADMERIAKLLGLSTATDETSDTQKEESPSGSQR